ncbi:MAG: class I SAM-dependent methyltransferase [Primorskyibacter sp.]
MTHSLADQSPAPQIPGAPRKTAAFWDKAAEAYAASPIKDMDSYLHGMERTRQHLSPTDRVLEIGCGTATSALRLAPHVAHYTATDVSPAMIAIGQDKARTDGVDITFAVTEAHTAPGTGYNAILAYNLLHLVRDVPGTLARLYDQTVPGGVLVTKTPCLGHNPLFSILIPAMRLIGKAPYVGVFRIKTLEAMIRTAGFEILETGTFPRRPPNRFIIARKPG